MKILVLGGTLFLGRHLVEAALSRGHEVTIFHRGRTGEDLFPDVEHVHGERDGGLAVLEGRAWDVAIDTSGYVPRIVRAGAEALSGAVGLYAFVSTISVYGEVDRPGLDETAPVATLADPTVETVGGETYGPLKALCEQAVEAVFGDRTLVLRPGLLVGPSDPSDRFTYWPRRLAEGGDVLAPGPPGSPVQLLDSRDLAAWTIRLVEAGTTGTFHAAGPERALTMERFLQVGREAVGPEARLVWVDAPFLLEAGVAPWSDLPLWLPPELSSLSAVDVRRAFEHGLACRPLADTFRDTLAWDRTRAAHEPKTGIGRGRERELLAAWSAGR